VIIKLINFNQTRIFSHIVYTHYFAVVIDIKGWTEVWIADLWQTQDSGEETKERHCYVQTWHCAPGRFTYFY